MPHNVAGHAEYFANEVAVEYKRLNMHSFEVSIFNSHKDLKRKLFQQVAGASQFLQFAEQGEASEKAKLAWIIKLRWIAITLFFTLCGPAFILGILNRTTASAFLSILGTLLVINLISQLSISESLKSIGPFAIYFHIALDVIALTGILALTGGIQNPLFSLFFLHAALGGILIPGRLSWPFLLLTHTLLAALQLQYILKAAGILTQSQSSAIIIYHLITFGFWWVMRSLGAYLEKQNDLQKQNIVRLEKTDRLRSIGALAAGFSHEFASPLAVARISLERLKRNQDNEDVTEALDAVLACQEVIKQMNSAQLDARDFHFKTVIIGDLLEDIVESWQEEFPDLLLDLKTEENLEVSLPPVNFAQVMLNLLDNAFEANPQGPITIELTKIKSEILLTVRDQGEGFPENILRRLGEPFVTTKQEGTGLGLYVSELFVQSLGGRIEVNNLSPQGALVCLRWPIKRVAE